MRIQPIGTYQGILQYNIAHCLYFANHVREQEAALRGRNPVQAQNILSLDIENIGRRNFIRRRTNLRLAYDTPADKIQQALSIIRDILKDHEGMQAELPPRVFFDEFNPDSLNIFINYWFHPPRRWKAMEFDERINLEIVQRLNAEGIRLVPPVSTTHVSLENSQVQTP